jgi:beta-aspartyl-peptidase (threonine type)
MLGVACVRDVKNPVLLARAVLENSGHVLLVGEGASGFARESGIPAWQNERLVTAHQRARYEAARGREPGCGAGLDTIAQYAEGIVHCAA